MSLIETTLGHHSPAFQAPPPSARPAPVAEAPAGPALEPMEALFEFGRIYGMTAPQTASWLIDSYVQGEFGRLYQQAGSLIDRDATELAAFTADDAQALHDWIDANLRTSLPSRVELESAATGDNEATWSVDAQGRPVYAEATLTEIPPTDPDRPAEETRAQDQARERGREGDHGGHVIGYRFIDAQGLRNLFPQDGNFNVSAYKKLENEWAAWTEHGMDVQLEVTLSPVGQDRPDEVAVAYQVVDPADGEVVYDNKVVFQNESGQDFARIDYDDMPRYYS